MRGMLSFLIVLGLSEAVFADANSGFSYAAAERAYATAKAPAVETFAKEWMMIGVAYFQPNGNNKNAYAPDGKFPIAGYPGYFQEILSFTAAKDAFGNDIYSRTEKLIGYESRSVYRTRGPDAGMLTPDAYVSDIPASDLNCAERLECRSVNVTSGPMFLCAVFLKDARKGCAEMNPPDSAKPAGYYGFLPLVKP